MLHPLSRKLAELLLSEISQIHSLRQNEAEKIDIRTRNMADMMLDKPSGHR